MEADRGRVAGQGTGGSVSLTTKTSQGFFWGGGGEW